jgi:hypothetical protein
MHVFLAAEQDSKELIESDEMVYVSVCHKDMGSAEKLSRTQGMQISQIKHQGSSLIVKRNEKARIGKGIVDESRLERASHGQVIRYPVSQLLVSMNND